MTAQPIEHDDPRDPQVILSHLPERERERFLLDYREAVDAAHEVSGYRRLQEVLHVWSLVVAAVNQPDYYARLAAEPGPDDHVMIDEIERRRQTS